jgi:hypothetical protein
MDSGNGTQGDRYAARLLSEGETASPCTGGSVLVTTRE